MERKISQKEQEAVINQSSSYNVKARRTQDCLHKYMCVQRSSPTHGEQNCRVLNPICTIVLCAHNPTKKCK